MNQKCEISIGEHMLKTQMFMQALSDKMPEITETVNALFEIKRQRKLKGLTMRPKEKDESELDWDATTDQQGLGESNLSTF